MTTAIAEPPKKLATPPPIPADAGSPSVNIPVSRIVPSPWNRKADFDDLVESVRKNGVVQNVVLRPHIATEEDVALYSTKADPFAVGDKIFQLVAGERRWGAAKKAGRSHVPAAIRQLSDIDAMDFQIDENENRKNLRPMERAEAYDRLRMLYQEAHAKDKDYTEAKAIEAVAASRNCSSRTVYDIISLKKLTQNAQHALRNGEMETSHGVVLAGRSQEDQEKILLWIRQQTHHSQGDIPSVRRLKDEIRRADIAAEDKKRQEKLFKGSQPGTEPAKDSAVAKVVDQLYSEALRVVHAVGQEVHKVSTQLLQRRLRIDSRPAEELLARMEMEGIVRPEAGGFRLYIWPTEQKKEPVQQQAPDAAVNKAIAAYKPPTNAQLRAAEQQRQKEAKAADERRKKEAKFERENIRNARIDKKANALLFAAFARKAKISSRFLTHAIPDLVFSSIDRNNYEEFQIEPDFGQKSLGWPAPENGNEYSVEEICNLTKKHTRQFTPGLLAAVILSIHVRPAVSDKLAKYFGIDPKKLRKQAAAKIAEEERKARLPKAPTTKKEKQLHAALHHIGDAHKRWEKLRRQGASDAEIRTAVAYEFGLGGSSWGDEGRVSYKGGQKPAIFFNKGDWHGKPSLEGAALVAAVRDLLKIPEKGDVDA